MFSPNEPKTLIVYHKDSYNKYYDLYSHHLYDVMDCGDLLIMKICQSSGEETIIARFHAWDHFIIE